MLHVCRTSSRACGGLQPPTPRGSVVLMVRQHQQSCIRCPSGHGSRRCSTPCCRALSRNINGSVNNLTRNPRSSSGSSSCDTGSSNSISTSSNHGSEGAIAVTTLIGSIALGACLGGAGIGLDESIPESAQCLSACLGWSYFTAWSVSFYPQIIDNHCTRDVSGLSPDYLLFSVMGYLSYGAYTTALYFSDDVRATYASIHGGAMPDVSLADWAFAWHAVLATLIVSVQYCTMKRPGDKGLSPLAAGVGLTAVAACGISAIGISATCDVADCAAWLPMLVLLGGIKVACTLIKYTPQVLHNHQRRSTEGWNLTNVLLDLGGGILSFSQVALDAIVRHDLSVITGNPAKMWVAALSIGYDFIFVAQHYLYTRETNTSTSPTGSTDEVPAAVVPVPAPSPMAFRERGQPLPRAVLVLATAGRRAARSTKQR